ncbi:hypothetical protein E2C01_024713 [Portunus trituberculatus]|uniref:Uncharacterized protein n=1 Tax=Portunus trituberculatus TaxID=210409 RepID=A0A5B7EEG5_PORTR|nr:hypothetical protein [Portunus trituberculatus]
MILNGPTIQEQSGHSSASTPISQLMFNSYACCRQSISIESITHGHNRETSLPVYLGMLMHTKTRKRDLVDTLFHLGLSVSYDKISFSVLTKFISFMTSITERQCGTNKYDKQTLKRMLRGTACGRHHTVTVDVQVPSDTLPTCSQWHYSHMWHCPLYEALLIYQFFRVSTHLTCLVTLSIHVPLPGGTVPSPSPHCPGLIHLALLGTPSHPFPSQAVQAAAPHTHITEALLLRESPTS